MPLRGWWTNILYGSHVRTVHTSTTVLPTVHMTYLTYALTLPVEHRPQTTYLHSALSCAAFSNCLQLNLKPPARCPHFPLQISVPSVFRSSPCSVACSTRLAKLSSHNTLENRSVILSSRPQTIIRAHMSQMLSAGGNLVGPGCDCEMHNAAVSISVRKLMKLPKVEHPTKWHICPLQLAH